MFFDTHGHIDDEAFNEDREETIARTYKNGVRRFMNIGCSRQAALNTIELVDKYDWIYGTVGLHPQDAKYMTKELFEEFRKMAKHPKICAIGEIGLDYYYETSPRDVQKAVFAMQIRLAKELNMPITIHDRDAHGDIMNILYKENAWENGGIFHCYSGSAEMAKEITKNGFFVSFSGSVTFKTAEKLRAACAVVPLDKILIETDSPYLAPVPNRGHRNEPSGCINTAVVVARIHGLSLEEIAKITWENGCAAYKMKDTIWPGVIDTEYIREAKNA